MKELFDQIDIPIECASCDHKFKKSWGKLKRLNQVTCPKCRTVIEIDKKSFAEAVDRAEKADKKILESLRKLGR